ncbi:tyrosine-type recombinase/integrase [Novimethylophilus kurashikiensis]|nr:integrase family protein [Novimethylophilus kurashikiensis]
MKKVESKENFTADRIAKFKCEPDKQQKIFWDAKTPGLGLRVTVAGAKSYIFESRLHGKTLRITIGDVRTYSIGKAQEIASDYKALTNKGIDPRHQKAQQKAANEVKNAELARQTVTFGEAWAAYIEANKSSWGERHMDDHVRLSAAGGEKKKRGDGETVAGPLASLLSVRLADLTSENLAAWLTEESKFRPTSTALSYRLLRAFIRWTEGKAEYRGLIGVDAYKAQEVRKAIPKGQTKDDCLQREQLASWFDAVRKLNNPVISSYLQALLLTGARREELLGLRWEDIDFKWQSLTIRDKVEGQRVIPLTPYVASLLLDLKRRNATSPTVRQLRKMTQRGEEFKPSPWVFYSRTSEKGRLAEPRTAHNRAVALAGLPHLTLHGLRRSFGTLCEWVEVPTGISAQIMGHKPSAIAEKHYRRRPLDLLRMWHIKIEAWILEQAGVDFVPPVQLGLRVVS